MYTYLYKEEEMSLHMSSSVIELLVVAVRVLIPAHDNGAKCYAL